MSLLLLRTEEHSQPIKVGDEEECRCGVLGLSRRTIHVLVDDVCCRAMLQTVSIREKSERNPKLSAFNGLQGCVAAAGTIGIGA